jgi:serine/threonine-protein kinase
MNADPNPAKAIFLEAVERHAPEQWRAFLDRACAGQPDLRGRVEMLLQAHREVGTAQHCDLAEDTDPGPLATAAEPPVREQPGEVIGPYKLLEQIGEGGFGIVFMAEQTQPVRRKVALKVLKPGMDTKQVVARFEAERQALAIMDDPHIAKVFDGGATASGRPYFVMELVKGVPITEFCDHNQLAPRQRLELFLAVCQAVQHAHQKGIIHRDLKPSNVLVSQHDATPVVKVIDFGVAKALGQGLTDKTLSTGVAQMVGTPLYMSPEQAGMSDLDVDTRSDIYSLGVLLYELLTGTTPFAKERFQQAGYDEIRRIIREEEPLKPSTRISTLGQVATTVSTQRKTDPRRLRQLLRGELDWIVMKALEKDRNRRYETVSALAADVQRYLKDEPVQACPPSAWYRFGKFTRRKKTALAVVALILFFLALLGGGVGWILRDRSARQAKAANDLELALDRTEFFLEERKWAEAQAAFDQTRMLAGEVTTDSARDQRLAALEQRLAAGARDQKFVARFEEIRLQVQSGVDVEKSRFATEAAFPEIQNTLRDWGIEIGVTPPAQAALLITGRPEPVGRDLIAALGDCLRWPQKADARTRQWLLATLDAADKDPWRVLARKTLAGPDWKALEQVVREADIQKQPPSFLLFVAANLPNEMSSIRLELLRRIQQAYPADLWANHGLAYALKESGQPAEAVRYFTAALALRPSNPGIYLNRGNALRAAGELKEAIADYRRAIDLAPRYAAAHQNLANTLRDMNQLDEAIREYRKAIELNPNSAALLNDLGNALCQNKQPDDGIRAYRRAIELKPKYVTAHHNLGNALRDTNQLDEAIREFRTVIDLDPDRAMTHYNLATVLHAAKQVDEAIREYRRAIEHDPKDAWAHYGLGNVLRDMKQLNEAIREYRKAIDLQPEFAKAHYNLGGVLQETKQLDEAIREYRKATELQPEFAQAHFSLGNAHAILGQWDQAAAAIARALKLEPSQPWLWHQSATLCLHAEDLEGYRFACREMLARFGKTEVPRVARWTAKTCSLAADAVSDYESVLKLADRGVDKKDSLPYRWFLLTEALAEYRAGRYASAIEWSRRYGPKSAGPKTGYHNDACAFAILAMAHYRLGEAQEAREALGQAQTILANKMPQPAKGEHFGLDWADWLHGQILCREAEALLGTANKGTQDKQTKEAEKKQ